MAWYKSKKAWASVGIGLVSAIDHYGRLSVAHDIYLGVKDNWPRIASVIPAVIPWIALGMAILFFESERRKSKRPIPHDLETLRGRTLQLRDDMQTFLQSAPPKDSLTREKAAGMTDVQILEHAQKEPRQAKLSHGYHLRFAARIMTIYHEFGERAVSATTLLGVSSHYQVLDDDFYRRTIDLLTELAELPEAAN